MIKATIQILSNVQASLKLPISVVSTGSSGGNVQILDQNNDVIATVAAPGTYNVLVIDGVTDTTLTSTPSDSIIDNPFA